MFKTQVVDSRNIRKTIGYKVIQIVLIPVLLFIIALSFHLFGHDSAIEKFFRENQSSIMRPIAFTIIILALGFSLITKSRMKNPRLLGNIELDEKGFRFLANNNIEYSGSWDNTRFVSFEYFSSANINNPRGCQNYLTIVDVEGIKTYEITIESSLIKADLGEILRSVNTKIPVRVRYTTPLKKIFRDNDFKF
jgi:hypothetical protein